MALDFSRFGTPVDTQKSVPDFSQFGTLVQSEKSAPDFSKFGTPVKRQETVVPAASESELAGAIGVSPEFGATVSTSEPAPPKIKYADIAKRDDLFNIADRAMKAYGKPGFDEKKESREQFVERFYSQQRFATTNTSFGTIPLLYQLKNSDTERARDLAAGFRMFDVAENSPKTLTAIGDYVYSVFSDPTTYMGLGVGKATAAFAGRKGVETLAKEVATQRTAVEAAKAAAKTPVEKVAAQIAQVAIEPQRQAAKKAIERSAFKKGVAASTVAEGVVGTAADVMGQRASKEALKLTYDISEQVPVEIQPQEEEFKTDEEGNFLLDAQGKPILDTDISLTQAATVGAINAALAGLGSIAIPGAATTRIRESGEAISEALKRKGIETTRDMAKAPTDAEKNIAAALTTQFDDTVSTLIKERGRDLLDSLDPATVLTDSKIKPDLVKISTRVALNVLKQDPLKFGYTGAPDSKISDAVYRVISTLDNVDNITFEQALTKSGVTLDDFAAMNLTTASESGRNLQQLSVLSRNLKKARELEPGIDEKLKRLYSQQNDAIESLSRFQRVVEVAKNTPRWLMNETKAIVVSGIDTLSRNSIGNATGLGMKASVRLLEGYSYAVGKAVKNISADKPVEAVAKEFYQSVGDAHGQAFGMFMDFGRAGLMTDITERLLANNPVMLSRMASMTQDLDSTQQLSRVSRWAVSFNSSMDSLFRRHAFVDSVEYQLKAIGMDLYKDILAKDKDVPASILQRAYDESAKDTFSYNPKEFAKTFSKFEDFFEHRGADFVNFFDRPVAEIFVTFPRFVTNAVAFQYKYSPLGLIGARGAAREADKLAKEGNEQAAALVRQEAVRKHVQAVVGMGLLAWGISYRMDNQDIGWSERKNSDGSTSDMKAIFPVAPVLAFSDLVVKSSTGIGTIDYKGITESMIGFKAPGGTQNTILGGIVDYFTSEEKRIDMSAGFGKVVGDYFGRALEPFIFKQLFDFANLMRGDEGVKARDPNVLEAETAAGQFAEAAAQRIQAKLPVFKESLPEAVPRLKDTTEISKEGEFVNRIIGFRTIPARSDLEKEITKYGVDLYKKYGRPSGDREFDRMAILITNRYALPGLENEVKTPEYAQSTPTEKKKRIEGAISNAVEEGRRQTRIYFEKNQPEKLARIDYLRLSADEKKIVNERYERDVRNRGEEKTYTKLMTYADMSNLKYATGGVVQQMDSLFGR